MLNSLNIRVENGEPIQAEIVAGRGLVVSTDEVEVNFNLEISNLVCSQYLQTQQISCKSSVLIEMGFVEK